MAALSACAMETVTITTFYSFVPLAEPAALKAPILARMQALGIKGTITLASEGVNATISGAEAAIAALIADLRDWLGMVTPTLRSSYFSTQPFQRTKVKVKRELISLGVPSQPSVCVGEYVMPKDWNALITAPNVITIDTRNAYEFELGHFEGAVNPATRNFKQMVKFTEEYFNNLAPSKQEGRKGELAESLPSSAPTPALPLMGREIAIAMYCTGGIRCEKYSSYLVAQGFSKVYHLHGGILAYLEQIPTAQSLWRGNCFVFDERVAVGHGLTVAA